MYLSSLEDGKNLTEDGDKDGLTLLREDEEFITAVQEVKGAAQNVTSSAGELTKTIVTNGPNIMLALFNAMVSKEMR